MNRFIFFITAVALLVPILTHSENAETVLVRAEDSEENLGVSDISISSEPCTIRSHGQKLTKTFDAHRAICVFDTFADLNNIQYEVQFYGETGILKGMRKDGVDYTDGIWFAIDHDFFPDNCDALWGVSITTCDVKAGQELVIIHDNSSFYPFLSITPPVSSVVGSPTKLVVADAVTESPIEDSTVNCANLSAQTTAKGIATFTFSTPATISCVATKFEHYRSAPITFLVADAPPEDVDEPPSNLETPTNPPAQDPPSIPANPGLPNPLEPTDPNSNPPDEENNTPPDSEPNEEQEEQASEQEITVRTISYSERLASAQRGAAFLRRLQTSSGDIGTPTTSPWAAVAFASLGRAPYDVHDGGTTLDQALWNTSPPSLTSSLDVSRVILGFLASGRDPKNIDEHNYCSDLLSYYKGEQFGDSALYNDDFFAVLALVGCDESRLQEKVARKLLSTRKTSGGFSMDTLSEPSVDMTAIAIQVFVVSGVSVPEESLTYILSYQLEDGGFPYAEDPISNVASTAWAIQGLVAAGVNPNAVVSPETGNTPWSYLLAMQQSNGGFPWQEDQEPDSRMTAYAIPALMSRPLPVRGNWGALPELDNGEEQSVTTVSASDVETATEKTVVETQDNRAPVSAIDEIPLSNGEVVLGITEISAPQTLQKPTTKRDIPDVRYAYAILVLVSLESLVYYSRTLKKD